MKTHTHNSDCEVCGGGGGATEYAVSLRYNLLLDITHPYEIHIIAKLKLKHYGLTLVLYKCAASHDLEPMYLIYGTIFKKRVCLCLSVQL